MAFEFFQPGSIRSPHKPPTGVLMTFASASAKRQAVRIRLAEDVMKKLRWLSGDCVVVGFDVAMRLIRICRVTEGGYTLSPQNRHEGRGKARTSSFQILANVFPSSISASLVKSLKSKPYHTNDYIADHDGVTFDWPA